MSPHPHPFDLSGQAVKPTVLAPASDALDTWWTRLTTEAQARKAVASQRKTLSPAELEHLARQILTEFQPLAVQAGVPLPDEFLPRLIGE
ncbi:MAG: hypothetical protein HUU38_13390, partial [Anaerolineales bacterium]|nr:hypothetical protein [Anaerolineales bacterium]